MTTDDEFIANSEAILREKYGIEPEPPPPEYDPSLIPDASFLSKGTINPAMTELKERVDSEVSLFDVYDHYCPPEKKRAYPRPGQREGILFSCPSPTHPDEHPSAWANIEGLWYCGVCGAKGDLYNVAALVMGVDYRADFREVLLSIADAFNIEYNISPITGKILQDAPAAIINIINDEATIEPEPEPIKPIQPINWRYLFGTSGFGRAWMDAMQHDDAPEEFYVWEAFLALGLAIGRDVFTPDLPPLYSNLNVCLFGNTGTGKSRTMRNLSALLERAIPDRRSDPHSKGVFLMPQPGSAEALIDLFSRPVYEDDNVKDKDKVIIDYGAVRGLIMVDEFASLLAKSESGNNIALKARYTTLFDAPESIAIYSRGAGEVVAKNTFCSIVASTQPTAIRSSLGYLDTISGFMNRYIFVVGTPKKRYSMNRPSIDLTDAVVELQNLRSWASRGHQIQGDDDAFVIFDKFFHEVIEMLDFEALPMMARIDITLRKIALLLAANDHSDVITAEIMERTISLYDYLKSTYEFVGGNIVSSTTNDLTDWLTSFCRDHAVKTHTIGPTVRDISRHLPRRFDSKQFVEGMRHAVAAGLIAEMQIPSTAKGGRPTTRYVYQA